MHLVLTWINTMATARLTIGTLLGTVHCCWCCHRCIGYRGQHCRHGQRLRGEGCEGAGWDVTSMTLHSSQLTANEGTMAEAEMNLEVIKSCAKSTQHKELFETGYEKYAKLHGIIVDTEDNSTITKLYAAE